MIYVTALARYKLILTSIAFVINEKAICQITIRANLKQSKRKASSQVDEE